MAKTITVDQWVWAAKQLRCELEVIQAVGKVESKGSGFLPDGRVKILFEPHIFYRELGKPKTIAPEHRDIIYIKQGTRKYGTLTDQYKKLYRAIKINPEAAYKSASWGKFQAMGQYHRECGFKSVYEMVAKYQVGEFQHLEGFIKMIMYRKLDDELRNKNFLAFALAYNGKEQKGYDIKMKDTYDALIKIKEARLKRGLLYPF